MAENDTAAPSGPVPGIDRNALDQQLRNASALLDVEELPNSFFVAVQHDNGTDYLHAHADDRTLDGKVYDLFAPLAIHLEQVARAANSDPETAADCALELLEGAETIDRIDP